MAKTALKKTTAGKLKAEKKTPTKKKVKVQLAADKATPAKACKVGGCKREYRAKGYCRAHYKKWRQGGFGKNRYKACNDVTCFKPMAVNRHGLCEEHFQSQFVKRIAAAKPAPAAPKADAKPDPKPDKAAANG